MAQDPDQRIADIVERERARLRNFVRRRVPRAEDVEDIVQEVFSELVEANRRLMPIDHVTGWLFRVARNRIIDLFRQKQPERFSDAEIVTEDGERLRVEDLLASEELGPDGEHARRFLIEEFERALDELPDEQRTVFVAHEIDGVSFKQLSAQSGINVNTLLARKRYAVLHLRKLLQRAFDEFNALHRG
jgi:RNA polymerase sigma factor (sigma-70 family)